MNVVHIYSLPFYLPPLQITNYDLHCPRIAVLSFLSPKKKIEINKSLLAYFQSTSTCHTLGTDVQMTRHDIKLVKNLFTCTTVSTVTHRVPITIIQKGKMKEMQKDSTRLFASANRSPRLGSNEFSLKKKNYCQAKK